ncbi:cytochrome P450 [Methylobacterium nonmethylotrophicum]|uniref:Cytochrome P450 n=1 Tax=Methylobacterium nonmethylotrophicum TaxID=1141884 RepID=A0A4Z0NVY4_9HYPH|nr:cytochrome P450 [Methylobacterium nonmethylotrophicum]TGE01222.1 cytochrome P450 [Methylobacterium nonmethylotrophicum]
MWLLNLPVMLWRRLLLVGEGLGAALLLAGEAAAAISRGSGPVGARLAALFASPVGQRRVFAVLRLVQPNLRFGTVLVAAYANSGTAIVTRRDDVIDVLSRDDDFGVVYGPRMKAITDGENFFLGMQDTPRYTRDVSAMRLVVRREDVPAVVAPFVAREALSRVAAAGGRIDVPQALTLPVAAGLLDHYFGTPGPSRAEMVDWTTTLFWYLFLDLQADPALDAKAASAAASFRDWLGGHIAARKASGETRDDVLGRCLALQASGTPGLDDRAIRDNLIGLLIGELPTTSAAATLALDELLDRPAALAGAQKAARAGDDDGVAGHVFEALRFRPLNPVIYRRAMRDATVAGGTLRARRIPEGTMVFAANLSAMFDPLAVPQPGRFRIDRPWDTYMLWGHGLHLCFGAHLNRATLPGLLKPLLARRSLRRAEGPRGRIDQQGTPFPVHLEVMFEG